MQTDIEQQRNNPKNISLIKKMISADIINKMKETFNANDVCCENGEYGNYIRVPLHFSIITKDQLKKVMDLGIYFHIDIRINDLGQKELNIIIPLEWFKMSKVSAIKYINIYISDCCNEKSIQNNNTIHPRFVKEMLESIKEQILNGVD